MYSPTFLGLLLVVPGHGARPSVWRSLYRAGILAFLHRAACI